jgi:hypothetical protein
VLAAVVAVVFLSEEVALMVASPLTMGKQQKVARQSARMRVEFSLIQSFFGL